MGCTYYIQVRKGDCMVVGRGYTTREPGIVGANDRLTYPDAIYTFECTQELHDSVRLNPYDKVAWHMRQDMVADIGELAA